MADDGPQSNVNVARAGICVACVQSGDRVMWAVTSSKGTVPLSSSVAGLSASEPVMKVKVKFTLEQAMKRCSPTLFLNLGARWEWVVIATPRPLYPR